MTATIKKVKVKNSNGTFDTIPIGADASNITLTNGETVQTTLNNLSTTVTTIVNQNPTILKGTAAPSSSQGKDGDLYIQYT